MQVVVALIEAVFLHPWQNLLDFVHPWMPFYPLIILESIRLYCGYIFDLNCLTDLCNSLSLASSLAFAFFFIRKRKTLPRAKIMLITVIVNLVEIEGGHDIYGEMCHYHWSSFRFCFFCFLWEQYPNNDWTFYVMGITKIQILQYDTHKDVLFLPSENLSRL